MKKLTTGQKAWKTRKWREAEKKSHNTHVNSRTFTRWNLTKKGYRCVTFQNKNGREPADGVVDLVAIKKDKKDKNRLKIILFQLKGGTARIKPKEIAELKKAIKKIKIDWNYAEKRGKKVTFHKEI